MAGGSGSGNKNERKLPIGGNKFNPYPVLKQRCHSYAPGACWPLIIRNRNRKKIPLRHLLFAVITRVHLCGTKSEPRPTLRGNGGSTAGEVLIANILCNPSTITVQLDTPVTWKNNDPYALTVTADEGSSFNSGTLPGKYVFIPSDNGRLLPLS
jgi:hypothetical protein